MFAVPFTRIHLTGAELDYIREAIETNQLAGDGLFARRCERLLEQITGCERVLLTNSCTAALEIAAILSDVGPRDEVIMPSFTFVSTANAFVLRGATPVFVDIEPRTLTLDPEAVAAAVSAKTRVIVPVHYAGVPCELDAILQIAHAAGAMVIEDAAQALLTRYRGRALGTFGQLATLSFHQTKNVTAGEGGALMINDPELIGRAEIIREKGTDRSRFYRGEVDKYTWIDIGSSYLPGELIAAFLLAQLEQAREITRRRLAVWERYHLALEPLEQRGALMRPATVPDREGNGHIYFILLPSLAERANLMEVLRRRGICAVFHYVPLHSSPAGLRLGRSAGPLRVTEEVSERLLRLPLWPDMDEDHIDLVVDSIYEALRQPRPRSEIVGNSSLHSGRGRP